MDIVGITEYIDLLFKKDLRASLAFLPFLFCDTVVDRYCSSEGNCRCRVVLVLVATSWSAGSKPAHKHQSLLAVAWLPHCLGAHWVSWCVQMHMMLGCQVPNAMSMVLCCMLLTLRLHLWLAHGCPQERRVPHPPAGGGGHNQSLKAITSNGCPIQPRRSQSLF